MDAPKKSSNNGLKIFGFIAVLGLIAGAIYLFSRGSKKETQSTTTNTTESNSGLSGVLSGLNLSGLHLF